MDEAKEESIIRKVLNKEVTMVVSIVAIVAAVIGYVTVPERANKEQIEYLRAEIAKNQALADALTKTQQNDLHTLEGNYAKLNDALLAQTLQITRLTTIIEERIPAQSIKK